MRKLLLTINILFFAFLAYSQELPLIGAQVFIEPGQTESETELWFKTMKENGMKICRIRMFESYMKKEDGTWDFSLFDRAFRYAEKYNIKVMGTFFPATEKTDIGGWKFPKDQQQLESFAVYIKQCVLHFRQYKSLYAWVLINEPGGGLNDNDFSRKMRAKWDKQNPQPEYLENGYPILVDLQDGRFRNYMTSWMLNWIAGVVRKYDKDIHLHVNNHAIFNNLAEYNFPYWRTFLNSLGGSAHASWHFGMFTRQQYALAMSANSEILFSGAGDLPWLMTELQGGNNTYSGNNAMCPTKEEIAQWLWTIIGTDGKGGIFWSLNPRASGVESGEWALLDFMHQPTDRVNAIRNIITCLDENQDVFSKLKKADNGINLVYFKESFWTEEVITNNTPASTDGRKTGLKDLLGYFKAFSEIGVSPNIKAFEEFDFSKNDYSGTSIVLAHQIAVPLGAVAKLEHFVSHGGKLFIDGLTAFYNEQVHNWMLTGFPLKNLFGGQISEFQYLSETEEINIDGSKITISFWKGFILPDEKSETMAQEGNHTLAVRSSYGSGEVVWIPALLGMEAWKNGTPLAQFLQHEFKTGKLPVSFDDCYENVIMKTQLSGNSLITVLINKNNTSQTVGLHFQQPELTGKILFSNGHGKLLEKKVYIQPEETMVIVWDEKN